MRCLHCPQVKSAKDWGNTGLSKAPERAELVEKHGPRRSEDIHCARLEPKSEKNNDNIIMLIIIIIY